MLFVVVDSMDSDWLARLHPSLYTAVHRFGIVVMPLNVIMGTEPG